MVRLGTEIESPQTGERLTFLSTADSSDGELFRAELTMEPGDYVVRSHVHPRQEETFVPPLFVQGPLFAALAAIARRRGYRARYPGYALPSAGE